MCYRLPLTSDLSAQSMLDAQRKQVERPNATRDRANVESNDDDEPEAYDIGLEFKRDDDVTNKTTGGLEM